MLPRELLTVGGFTVYSFGLTIAVGMLVGLLIAIREGDRKRLPDGAMFDALMGAVIGGLVGARLLYVLLDLKYYLANPHEIFRPDHGGLSFYGGLALGIAVAWFIARRRGISFSAAADAAAPGIAIAYGIARIGCDLYGRVANVTWAVWISGQPHHPTQAYSAIMGFIMFGILWARRERALFAGEQFTLFVGLYAAGRFLVEFTRYGPMIGPFTLTQVITMPIGIAALALLHLGRRRARMASLNLTTS
jgi:phosphatidylglycerol:prolipoprotein diacylglycerol transferase